MLTHCHAHLRWEVISASMHIRSANLSCRCSCCFIVGYSVYFFLDSIINVVFVVVLYFSFEISATVCLICFHVHYFCFLVALAAQCTPKGCRERRAGQNKTNNKNVDDMKP